MQPIMYEVGALWEKGHTSVEAQHYYSAIVESMIDIIHEQTPQLQRLRKSARPKICVLPAAGNHHTLAIRTLELLLMFSGVANWTSVDNLPDDAIVTLLRRSEPPYFGVSLSMPEQIPYVQHLQNLLLAHGFCGKTRLVIGALLFRERHAPDLGEDVILVRSVASLHSALR